MLSPSLPPHLKQYTLVNWNPRWKLILADFLEPRRASFQWSLARGSLFFYTRRTRAPVGLVPAHRRALCLFCGAAESTMHIFLECAIPRALLRKIVEVFDLPGIPYETVRFLNPLPRAAINQFVLLLVECSYQVWLARCAVTHSAQRPGLHEVLAKVRKEVWFHLRREQRRLGAQGFASTWCSPAVIFEETGGNISVTY